MWARTSAGTIDAGSAVSRNETSRAWLSMSSSVTGPGGDVLESGKSGAAVFNGTYKYPSSSSALKIDQPLTLPV